MAGETVRNPFWTVVVPLAGLAAVLAEGLGASLATNALSGMGLAVLVGFCVFAAVHHAEVIGTRTGEPYGSIVLALAVTVLEVGLIISLMAMAPDGGQTIARDTVYSAIMIITTGIVGLSLVFGSRRYFEQRFRIRGTASAMSVLSVLAVITLVLPNYTVATLGPTYSTIQLAMVAIISLLLYCTFLFVQTVRHREYFLPDGEEQNSKAIAASPQTVWASVALLAASLAAVILLAKSLAPALSNFITGIGLPLTFSGVIIATLVLMPEGIAAVRAALANRLQVSINLALGSGLATIGLTIPAVAAVDILFEDKTVALGISQSQTVLLMLALFVNAVTLSNGRTNILFGAVHISIFAMFLLISAVP